ncbi:MAG: hypothetical protein AAFQ80_14485 [Cyanobacteria bacterium J06621_8]
MKNSNFTFYDPGRLVDDDLASRRTCEILGGKLIEIIDLPPDNDQYLDGDLQKCRYRLDL